MRSFVMANNRMWVKYISNEYVPHRVKNDRMGFAILNFSRDIDIHETAIQTGIVIRINGYH